MLNVLILITYILIFIINYSKLKEGVSEILIDIVRILVAPLQLISWVIWKISLRRKR